MINRILLTATLAALALNFSACEKHNEGEQINTIELTLVNANGLSTVYNWKDLDGAGRDNPTVDSISLDSGSYSCKVRFLNVQNGNTTDITEEVRSEGHEHLICYFPQNITMPPLSSLAIEATDKDKNGVVLGLESRWSATGPEFGTVQITLKHQPKSEVGTKTGDCAVGETDVQVSFPYSIR